jgi:uncharacterized protein YjiS (DUF1127 family)
MTIRAEPQSFQSASALAPAASNGPFVRFAKAVSAYWRNRRNRRSVAQLLEMDDYVLKDIGITRYDVTAALAGSPKDDPSERLKQLAAERRSARQPTGSYDFQRWLAPIQP